MLGDLTPDRPKLPRSGRFITTQWTRVLKARGDSPDAQTALSELCAAYYQPVFAFICNNVHDIEAARDLTQEFFMRLLSRNGIHGVDPDRGRFRSFLLGAVKHFLSDQREYAQRLKRGGDQTIESIGSPTDTSPGLDPPDEQSTSAEREFDRKWGFTMLERALNILALEHKIAGTSDLFEVLKPWLTGEKKSISQAEMARQLGMNQGAVKVMIHRLRRRFREIIKNEIAQTLDDSAQIEDEMHYLLEALV